MTTETKTFELNGTGYETDAETLAVLQSIIPAAKRTGDASAVQAILSLGLTTKRIREIN